MPSSVFLDFHIKYTARVAFLSRKHVEIATNVLISQRKRLNHASSQLFIFFHNNLPQSQNVSNSYWRVHFFRLSPVGCSTAESGSQREKLSLKTEKIERVGLYLSSALLLLTQHFFVSVDFR